MFYLYITSRGERFKRFLLNMCFLSCPPLMIIRRNDFTAVNLNTHALFRKRSSLDHIIRFEADASACKANLFGFNVIQITSNIIPTYSKLIYWLLKSTIIFVWAKIHTQRNATSLHLNKRGCPTNHEYKVGVANDKCASSCQYLFKKSVHFELDDLII